MSRWPDWRRRMPRILGVTLFLLGVVCVIEVFSAAFRRAVDVTIALLVVGILVGWAIVAMFPGRLHGGTLTYLGYAASKVLGGSARFTPRSAGETSGAVSLILGLFGAIAVLAGFATLL